MAVCDICKQIFARKYDLARHVQTTHRGSKFECNVLNKSFNRRENLIQNVTGNNVQVLNTSTSSVGVGCNIIVPITPATSDTNSLCSSSTSTNQTFSSNETNTTPSSKAAQTLKSWSDNTPRKKSLVAKYKTEKAARIEAEKAVVTLTNQISNLNTEDTFLKYCEKHLPPSLCIIIESHLRCKNTTSHSDEFKQFALTMYFLGPAVYRFLKPTFGLSLPRTLRRISSKYELTPGLNDFLFEFLRFKISNYKSEALDCTLCADETALKTHLFYALRKDEIIGFHQTNSSKSYAPAKFALVLMIRGINKQWEQPVAYFLVDSCSENDLHNIITSTIRKLQNISLNVKAFITDQGTNFLNFSKIVYVSPSRPYFYVNEQKIVYIFDPPHLLKSTRNMFFKHNFIHNEKCINNKYLIQFYNEDSKTNIRSAPKLTHAHIYPGPFEKTRVYLAAQVFSHSVAAAMSTYQSLGKLSIESNSTIQFIQNIDKLFDLFNSSKIPNSKDFRRPFKNTTTQKEYIYTMISFFEKLKVVTKNNGSDVTNRMNFINGWLISLNGLLSLWYSVQPENDDTFVLYTSRLNTDSLEHLFGMFRFQNRNIRNPTPVQFYCTFKKLFFLNYFQHSADGNCLKDLDNILCHSNPEQRVTQIVLPKQAETPINFLPYLKVGDVDYRYLNIPESNALSYICGYLYGKCLTQHTCDECVRYGHSQKDLDKSFLLCYFKAYQNKNKTIFGNLQTPHNDFHNYIFELENIFIERFPTLAIGKKVGLKLKDSFFNVPFNHPCPHFDIVFLLKLYVRLRVFFALKFLNRKLISERKLKNRKLTIIKHL